MSHIPVLQKEVLKYLNPQPNENFIDATFGEGGHAFAILEKIAPNGKVLAIELDPALYEKLSKEKVERLVLVNDSFVNLKEIVQREKFKEISGILFDLGLSSWHLESSGRGFSFQRDEPLIMRYDGNSRMLTAEKILNQWPERDLEKILKKFAQEKFAKRIAKEIIRERKAKPIKTTLQLVEIIKRATPRWYHQRKIHFATKTFQALRIAVNEELTNLEIVLPQALEILKIGGRMVVISFHSLEDKIVKNFLKSMAQKGCLKILTKKVIRPSIEEIQINPRARSAKLRAAQKI